MTKNYNDLGVEFKYLIVNDMDQKYGLWVNTVGFQSIQPNSPYPLKDHPTGYFFNAQKGRILREYQLVYITKGRGVFSSETTPDINRKTFCATFSNHFVSFLELLTQNELRKFIRFSGLSKHLSKAIKKHLKSYILPIFV